MKYKLISSMQSDCGFGREKDELNWLENEINDYIKRGWEPLGGLAIRHGAQRGCYFVQALINNSVNVESIK